MITRGKAMAEIQQLKKLLDQIKIDLKTKATNEKIDELLLSINEKDKKIDALEVRVEILESQLAIQQTVNDRLERKIDDLEQYQRRTSLRVNGITVKGKNETAEDCLLAVKNEVTKLGFNLPDYCYDRAHRVGRIRRNPDGTMVPRAIIVKFNSWSTRTAVYRKRRKWDGGDGGTRFSVDLTKRHLALKKLAIERVKDVALVDFAFADVNCNICLRLKNGEFKFFSSEEELDKILDAL